MNKTIRLKKHIKAAKKFQAARKSLFILLKSPGTPACVRKILFSILTNIDTPRSLLDDHYHDLITDKEFKKLGHIYYHMKDIK